MSKYSSNEKNESFLSISIHPSSRKTPYNKVKRTKNKSMNDIPESPKPMSRVTRTLMLHFKSHSFICSDKCNEDELHPENGVEQKY